MAFQVRVKRGNGEVVMTDVFREATPIFGSTIYVLVGEAPLCVQIVGLSRQPSRTHGMIDLLEAEEARH